MSHFLIENFDSLPDEGNVRVATTAAVTALSRSTLYRLHRAGTLKMRKITERTTGHRVGDVRAFLAGKDAQ